MKTINIKHRRTGDILFEGVFDNLRHCVEQAVIEGVCLDGADFSHSNLVNANLDDASLRQACFTGANLMGANLSDACLDNADFTNANLQAACLCFSSLRYCNFTGCLFGATDIAGADLSHSLFSTLSAFSLNFRDAKAMAHCLYQDADTYLCPISKPPIAIQGLTYPVILMDTHIKVGKTLKPYKDWLNSPLHHDDKSLYSFLNLSRDYLQNMISIWRPAALASEQQFY